MWKTNIRDHLHFLSGIHDPMFSVPIFPRDCANGRGAKASQASSPTPATVATRLTKEISSPRSIELWYRFFFAPQKKTMIFEDSCHNPRSISSRALIQMVKEGHVWNTCRLLLYQGPCLSPRASRNNMPRSVNSFCTSADLQRKWADQRSEQLRAVQTIAARLNFEDFRRKRAARESQRIQGGGVVVWHVLGAFLSSSKIILEQGWET